MKILIGVPTYGNIRYTLWTLYGVRRAIEHTRSYDSSIRMKVNVIVGKPVETQEDKVDLIKRFEGTSGDSAPLSVSFHEDNMGLPWSLNEIFYEVREHNYDYALIIGNDVIIAPWFITFGVDIIKSYKESGRNIDWLSGIERRIPISDPYSVIDDAHIRRAIPLIETPPEMPGVRANLNEYAIVGDSFNATFFSKRLIQTIGYVDCNFWPAYFSDNDYARRAQLAELTMRQFNGMYLHMWSRTIYNEEYKGVSLKEINDFIFPRNKLYYERKWGGEPGKETLTTPFQDEEVPKFYSKGIAEMRPFNKDAVYFWRSLVVTHFNL